MHLTEEQEEEWGSRTKTSALSVPPKPPGHLGISLNFTIKIHVDPSLDHMFLISEITR